MNQGDEVILKSARQLRSSCGGTVVHVGSPRVGTGRAVSGEVLSQHVWL